MFFDKCKTVFWDAVNPFFDVVYNAKTNVYSGEIKAKQPRIKGYPSIEKNIGHAIATLNLNADVLVEARKEKWYHVQNEKERTGKSWEELFNHYLNLRPYTDFHEFVLLAIRKQAP